jgi:predicted nucleic acid-binding protein
LKRIVVDASVAAKWLLPPPAEPLLEEASRLLRAYHQGEYELFVPDLFWVEIANFLWKAARRGRCTLDEGLSALETLQAYRFPTVSCESLVRAAFHIAHLHNRTVYDCLYVVLAEEKGAEVITADEKLANALPARYRVKLLSAL